MLKGDQMLKLFTGMTRAWAAGVLMAFASSAAAPQAYPSKPIRFIVPYPPGSGTLVARLIGDKLMESWGQPVIVDPRPGGDTIIGAEALVRSQRDGQTIMLISSSHVTINLLHKNVPFDAIKDVAAVATLTISELLLALHPSVPANNVKELIALAKSKPGQLNFASAGKGGPSHLAAELFNMLAGIKIQHVPYKGSGPAVGDLLGGHVQVYFGPGTVLIPHIKSGKLKAIAIGGDSRLPTLPQIPTFAEAGMPGFKLSNWYGLLAPAGTPKVIIDKLAIEIGKVLAMPDVKEKLSSQGLGPFISSPEQFGLLMKADMEKYAKIIKAANIEQN